MNSVNLIGRLTKDPEIRYLAGNENPIATITLAIDSYTRKDGTKVTDFPKVTLFGGLAKTAEKQLYKGQQVGVKGRLHTGSYQNKNGDKVYTTEVVADALYILEWKKEEKNPEAIRDEINSKLGINPTFQDIGADDIPF